MIIPDGFILDDRYKFFSLFWSLQNGQKLTKEVQISGMTDDSFAKQDCLSIFPNVRWNSYIISAITWGDDRNFRFIILILIKYVTLLLVRYLGNGQFLLLEMKKLLVTVKSIGSMSMRLKMTVIHYLISVKSSFHFHRLFIVWWYNQKRRFIVKAWSVV